MVISEPSGTGNRARPGVDCGSATHCLLPQDSNTYTSGVADELRASLLVS
jgi:hypothetical protein